MYKISEFASMIGQSQSKLRFYEKYGLFKIKKDTNGYRYYTQEDGFRFNAFRSLLQYGFTIEKTVSMLDMSYSAEAFQELLGNQEQDLEQQIQTLSLRRDRIREIQKLITDAKTDCFCIADLEDYYYFLASIGNDYSISHKNRSVIADYVEKIPVTSYVRIVRQADMESSDSILHPDYGIGMSESSYRKDPRKDETGLQVAYLGKCVCYYRKMTREQSAEKASYDNLFSWMKNHGYRLRGDILLFPHFLNLNGDSTDIERLIVPIE